MTFKQVKEKSERHKPCFVNGQIQLDYTVIKKSGKELLVTYPTAVFFELSSLLMFRFVPLYIDSIIAVLYSAKSNGDVKSSTWIYTKEVDKYDKIEDKQRRNKNDRKEKQ